MDDLRCNECGHIGVGPCEHQEEQIEASTVAAIVAWLRGEGKHAWAFTDLPERIERGDWKKRPGAGGGENGL